MHILIQLKSLRKRKGISQQKLAEAVGVSQQSINKYENHNIEPDIGTLIQIADFFSVSVDFLIGHSTANTLSGCRLIAAEEDLLNRYKLLNEEQRNCIDSLLNCFLKSTHINFPALQGNKNSQE